MPVPLSANLTWPQAATKWSSSLNPVILNPISSLQILNSLNLIIGSNVINHGLGRQMQGWFLTDLQGASTIYRIAPMNDLTLTLYSSAAVNCSIGVF